MSYEVGQRVRILGGENTFRWHAGRAEPLMGREGRIETITSYSVVVVLDPIDKEAPWRFQASRSELRVISPLEQLAEVAE